MALDFPNAPTLNQTFTAPNGVIWVWDGVKWTATTSTSPFTGQGNVGRNLLHNPLFNVWQRGPGPWTATAINTYTADRWKYFANLDTVSFAQTNLSDANRGSIGDEAANFALINIFTGNAGAAANTYVQQNIEGLRRLAGKTITVSFWAAASAALRFGVSIAQLFGSGGSPSADLYPNGVSVTLTPTPTRYSLTFTIPSISGKTLGTNGDDSTLLMLWYSSGATNNALSGSVGVQAGTIWIWGVQLEVGSVATPLEKPDPRYDLSNCQRFYSQGYWYFGGNNAGGALILGAAQLPVTMRAGPSITLAGSNTGINVGAVNCTQQMQNVAIAWAAITTTGYGTINQAFTASADL